MRSMNSVRTLVLASLFAAWSTGFALAEEQAKDPLWDQLIPPELVIEHGQRLGVSAEHLTAIQADVKSLQESMPQLQSQLKEQTRKLGLIIADSESNESAVLAQLDNVLDQEREVKRLHIAMLYRIRHLLNDSQRAELLKLKAEAKTISHQMQLLLKTKMLRVQKIVQQRMKVGRPPHEISEQMEAFKRLVKSSQPEAAEAVLDEVLEKLEAERETE